MSALNKQPLVIALSIAFASAFSSAHANVSDNEIRIGYYPICQVPTAIWPARVVWKL